MGIWVSDWLLLLLFLSSSSSWRGVNDIHTKTLRCLAVKSIDVLFLRMGSDFQKSKELVFVLLFLPGFSVFFLTK